MVTKPGTDWSTVPDPAARHALRLAWSSCVDTTQPATHVHDDALSAARLFEALDGRALFVDHQNWQVNVFSVHDEDGSRWVQLAIEGPENHPLTLRMSQYESVKAVIYALISWLSDPSATNHVLEVA